MAAGKTYEPIATSTLSSSQATITFDSISGSYTDLILVTMAKTVSGQAGLRIRFNSDSGANYGNVYVYGTGSTSGSVADSGTGTSIVLGYGAAMDSTSLLVSTTHIMNYSNATTFKITISRNGDGGEGVDFHVGQRRSTSAITRIDLLPTSGTFASGSTFSLYGIAAA
jgi:hypothetical protein